MMSVAGLGLSLGEAAQARSEPVVPGRTLANLGAPQRQDDNEPPAPGALDDTVEQALASPLDETLDADDDVVAASEAFAHQAEIAALIGGSQVAGEPTKATPSRISEEDRAAAALAMVLMAEPFAPAEQVASSAAATPPNAVDDASTNARSMAAEPWSRLDDGDAFAAQWVEALGRDLVREPAARVEAPAASAQPAAAAPAVDIPLEMAADVDVRLGDDMSTGFGIAHDVAGRVDLELALGADAHPGVDVRLDFPEARFAELDAAAPGVPAAEYGEARLSRASLDIDLGLPSAAARDDGSKVAAAPGPDDAATAEASASRGLSERIVVATHSERALRSLEALLDNDGSTAGRYGAQTDEIFVSSEAEKARMLLSLRRDRDASFIEPVLDHELPDASAAAAPAEEAPPSRLAVSPLLADELAMASAAGEPDDTPLDDERRTVRSALGGEMLAISEVGLDRVRGGFDNGAGVQISFGIDRAVYVNGNLVTTTSLNIVGSSKGLIGTPVSGATLATMTGGSSGSLTIVQNGVGNAVMTGPVNAGNIGTIVQNTLNDQKIQSVTAINATVNSLQVIKAQTLESSLRGALIDSLRR